MSSPNGLDLARRPVPPPLPAYHPLKQERNEIRLCSIQPGQWDDQITCKLLIYSLDRPVQYRCFSYVWGDASDRVPISLNGQAFSVTRNLWLALRRMRWYGQLDYFWIDAICINQEDVQEKTEQVRKMADIYSRTYEVIVWLGEEDCMGEVIGYAESPSASLDSVVQGLKKLTTSSRTSTVAKTERRALHSGTGFLVAFLKILAEAKPLTRAGYLKVCNSCAGKAKHLHYSGEWEIALRCLERFNSLPWFSRTWTVQELLLPQTAKVFIGGYSFLWSHLVKASSNFGNLFINFLSMLPKQYALPLETFCNQVEDMEIARSLCRNPGDHVVFASLLEKFQARQATDPRDKVFGLLGLQTAFGRHQLSVRADYSIGTPQLFTTVAVELVKLHRSLSVLEGDKRQIVSGLPSWVPDWTSTTEIDAQQQWRGTNYWTQTLSLYQAHSGKPEDFAIEYVTECGELSVYGINFDTVTNIADGSVTDRDPNHANGLGTQMLRFVDAFNEWFHGRHTYVTGSPLDDAFYRTLTGDLDLASTECIEFSRPANPQATRDFLMNLMSHVKYGSGNPINQADRAFASTLTATWQKRLFTTEKGYIGLGPITMRSGDMISVLTGGAHCFVLRPKRHVVGCATETKFIKIGTAYVHDLMDGEALRAGLDSERITLV